MANVYIEPRPKDRPQGSHIDAINWARRNGHAPLVARVLHLNVFFSALVRRIVSRRRHLRDRSRSNLFVTFPLLVRRGTANLCREQTERNQ